MIVSSIINQAMDNDISTKQYTQAEIQLNAYIRDNFPEWECKEI